MAISINAIIETLLNPEGRFLTLKGIYVETDSFGRPKFTSSGDMVIFRTIYNRKRHLLKCKLVPDPELRARMIEVCRRLHNSKTSYLVDYRYVPDEMLIFDEPGVALRLDVMLMELPDGVTLDEYMTCVCDAGDKESLSLLLERFCDVGRSMIGSDFIHGNLKPSNIIVNDDCKVKLVNYEYMRSLYDCQSDDLKCADNIPIANIALVIKVVSCNPSLYRPLNGSSLFRLPVLRSRLLSPLYISMVNCGCTPVVKIIEMIRSCKNYLNAGSELRIALEELSNDHVDLDYSIERDSLKIINPEQTESFDLSQYDWCGCECEGMIAVEKGEKWGYVNYAGDVIVDLKYSWVSDFCEGHAVVIDGDDCYAMIDKEGNYLLPPIYEFIDWNATYGVAKVTCDGLNGLCDRMGQEIVPFKYDWMGEIDVPLILVRDNGLCGYINHVGDVVIDLQYEDAFDFNSGLAIVVQEGEKYFIDLKGCRV